LTDSLVKLGNHETAFIRSKIYIFHPVKFKLLGSGLGTGIFGMNDILLGEPSELVNEIWIYSVSLRNINSLCIFKKYRHTLHRKEIYTNSVSLRNIEIVCIFK